MKPTEAQIRKGNPIIDKSVQKRIKVQTGLDIPTDEQKMEINSNHEVILECCGKPESECRCEEPMEKLAEDLRLGMYHGKPDESRLLTDEELKKNLKGILEDYWGCDYPVSVKQVFASILTLVKDHDARTASIKDADCQQRVERIFRDLEFMFLLKNHNHKKGEVKIVACARCSYDEFKRQALKKQELSK